MKKLILLTLFLLFGISIVLLLVGLYPKYIESIVSFYNLPNVSNDSPATIRGTFGDMYGALNSFLSGLAILGIVLTLFWETNLRKDEINTKEKEENEKEILKLKYFSNLVNGSYIASEDMRNRFSNMANGQQDNSDLPPWSLDVKFELVRTINKKINQEKYFLVFKKHLGDSEILNIYSSCAFIEMVEENLKKRYDLEVDKLNKRKEEFRKICLSIIEKFEKDNNAGKDSPTTQLDKLRLELFYYFTQNESMKVIGIWFGNELKNITPSLPYLETVHEEITSLVDANIDINTTFLKEFNYASKQLDTSNALLKKELDRLISHLGLKLDEPDKNRGNGNNRIKFKDMINDLIQKIKLNISSKGSLIVLITVLIISLFLLGGLDKASQFGSFFGGIVGPIVTACTGGLLYLSLKEQRLTNKLVVDSQRYQGIMNEIVDIEAKFISDMSTISIVNGSLNMYYSQSAKKHFSESNFDTIMPILLRMENVVSEAKQLESFSSVPIKKMISMFNYRNGNYLLGEMENLVIEYRDFIERDISKPNTERLLMTIRSIRNNVEVVN